MGLAYPETVEATITARLDKATNHWVPKVISITGHYSIQADLSPGEVQEVTGPDGNTTKSNYCAQLYDLHGLPQMVNAWYMLRAVVEHEKVHASRFRPALKAAKPSIVASIEEGVAIPNTPDMNKATAIVQLQTHPNFYAALVNAQVLWLTEIEKLVENDHGQGSPTQKAERKVLDPMIKSICEHAEAEKWPTCSICWP